jgi:hypothetical protein
MICTIKGQHGTKEFFMKNYIKLLGIIALAAVIVFSMAACKKSGGSSAPVAESAASTSSSNNVDKLLADYERFIDDYASLMEKVAAGDASAAADAQKLATEAAEWGEKWADVPESELTPAQVLKLQELTAKFTSGL